jgi:hypothetical protein
MVTSRIGEFSSPRIGPDRTVEFDVRVDGENELVRISPADAVTLATKLLVLGAGLPLVPEPTPGLTLREDQPILIAGIQPPALTRADGARFGLILFGDHQLNFQCTFAFTRELGQALIEIADQEEASRGPIN